MKQAIFLILGLCISASSLLAQPLLLLSDSFARTTGNANPDNGTLFSDWGSNDNALGGTIVQSYVHTPTRESGGVEQSVQDADDPADGDNEGVLRFGVAAVDHNLATDPNVLFGGGYKVEFAGRRTSSGFLSFFLGTDPALIESTSSGAAFLPVTSMNAGEHAYIFQAGDFLDLRMQVFESGMQLDPPGNINFVASDALAEFQAEITVMAADGFDVGDEITISASIDGVEIAEATHTVAVAGAFPGYVGWSSNSAGALIDDLQITALDTAPDTGTPGDFNGDGTVNLADYTLWRDNLGAADESSLMNNGDGLNGVDAGDYAFWKARFGNTGATLQAPGVAAVPEPATGALVCATLVGLLFLPRSASSPIEY